MIPIYEQGRGQGIGHSTRSFSERFTELCREHLSGGRARAFAFIFYDFHDRDFKRILKDQGVFAQLDRLSGNHLSIFYLHSGSQDTVERFNTEFLTRLGLEVRVRLPCVVFFRVSDDQMTDVAAVSLESASIIHGFHELHGIIEEYLAEAPVAVAEPSKYWRWVKSSSRFIGLETFRVWLKDILTHIM